MHAEMSRERDVRWVGRYAKWLAVLGVIVVILGLSYGIVASMEWATKAVKPGVLVMLAVAFGTVGIIGSGVIALGLGHLLAYAFGLSQRASWLLRHGDKGLYALAALHLSSYLVITVIKFQADVWSQSWLLVILGLTPLARAFVLVALGLILRRVLPIVEESRTLV
ncbi:hypothetical protein LCGC14_1363850 [marine sediment metagenome]|uniref:Ferric oxidoreductase domain-containing protein n=1 Tax=marine sediment metagenome TaxID=412755 RepID=A0A0F9K7C9_9ZZZZ